MSGDIEGESSKVDGSLLRQYVEKIERLEHMRAELALDMKDVVNEAKSKGFDAKALKEIVKILKANQDDRQAYESTLEVYKSYMGIE